MLFAASGATCTRAAFLYVRVAVNSSRLSQIAGLSLRRFCIFPWFPGRHAELSTTSMDPLLDRRYGRTAVIAGL